MNTIQILNPRWHDRKVLVADWKLGVMNEIVIKHASFPAPLYISGKDAMRFPTETKRTKSGAPFVVRVIPFDAFRTVVEVA